MPPWWWIWAERLARVLAEWWRTHSAGGGVGSADADLPGTVPDEDPGSPATNTPS